MMKVRFLISAKQDMQNMKSYIAEDNSQAAVRMIKKFREATKKLKNFPYSGRVIPEVENPDLREIILGNYRIMYQVAKPYINVFAVRESHQPYSP